MPLIIIPRHEVRDGERFFATMTEKKARRIAGAGKAPAYVWKPGDRVWGKFAIVDRGDVPWHEEVTQCWRCPFHHDDGRDPYCVARTADLLPAWRLTRTEVTAPTPPEWCPLRAGPRVVKLAALAGKGGAA